MFVALRSGIASSGIAKELCKILPKNNVSKFQVATLTRASMRNEDEVPNIKPFPYHNKPYHVINMLLDTNKCRVHKHSKVIVIDGPPATGKNQLAKELAKEFDFLYLPQPNFDDLYVSRWGFDYRTLDDQLPKDAQTWDIERFLQNPTDWNTASMQMYMLLMRQSRWMNALAHILMTGQGVVTVRSPWSDHVFAKAMVQNKYISAKAFEAHTDACLASLHFYLKPHLVIYLDVPVSTVQQNIKKRGLPHEKNAKALTDKYLTSIEENYKRDYLAEINEHSLLLIYDWSQGGDIEVVVEDIENLDFEKYGENDAKLQDWRFSAYQWKVFAKHFTRQSYQMLMQMDIVRTDVPELDMSGNDGEVWWKVVSEVDDTKYSYGYNPLKGDKNIMWNTENLIYPDNVTPLIKKYHERAAREKSTVSGAK